jgi:hypothetical protein
MDFCSNLNEFMLNHRNLEKKMLLLSFIAVKTVNTQSIISPRAALQHISRERAWISANFCMNARDRELFE